MTITSFTLKTSESNRHVAFKMFNVLCDASHTKNKMMKTCVYGSKIKGNQVLSAFSTYTLLIITSRFSFKYPSYQAVRKHTCNALPLCWPCIACGLKYLLLIHLVVCSSVLSSIIFIRHPICLSEHICQLL